MVHLFALLVEWGVPKSPKSLVLQVSGCVLDSQCRGAWTHRDLGPGKPGQISKIPEAFLSPGPVDLLNPCPS